MKRDFGLLWQAHIGLYERAKSGETIVLSSEDGKMHRKDKNE